MPDTTEEERPDSAGRDEESDATFAHNVPPDQAGEEDTEKEGVQE